MSLAKAIVGVAAAVAAAGFAGNARADESRRGPLLSIGIGAGHLGCADGEGNDCDGGDPIQAVTLTGEAGAFLTSNMALVGHLDYTYHKNDYVTVSQAIAAAAVRGWVVPRLWLEGGLGVARAKAKYEGGIIRVSSSSDIVPALVLGVGVDMLSTPNFALDVNLRFGTGLYRDDVRLYQTSLGVSASFF